MIDGWQVHVRSAVQARSRLNCEIGDIGCSQRAAHIHHRKLRGHGDHTEQNALHVCLACHVRVHGLGAAAFVLGWRVHPWDDAASVLWWPAFAAGAHWAGWSDDPTASAVMHTTQTSGRQP